MTTGHRALIMAGGGLKVAYQAGVLQVWLDEAGIDMRLATGSSGGTLNLAMWCQGFSGRQIADAWRGYKPLAGASVNPRLLLRGPFGPAMLSQKGLRKKIFPAFGLDWHAIRNATREGVFDVYNFSAHEHRAVPAAELTEDLLLSAVALPWWFNPVRIGSDTYIDAVFATDANLDEAIRRGATELWVVWTVSTGGTWRNGFVNGYFQMIEAMANAGLRASLRRVEDSTRAIADGRPGHYPHPVKVRVLAAEVPMHYLLVFSRRQVRRAVELGVRDARRWCADRGIPLSEAGSVRGGSTRDGQVPETAGISFRETMAGDLRLAGEHTSACELRLEVTVDDIDHFVADPGHVAQVRGTVFCPRLGGELTIHSGTLNLLAQHDVGDLRMSYELTVSTEDERKLKLRGEKFVRHDTGFDVWRDTTTLYLTVHDDAGTEVAAGVLRLSPLALARQLASMRGVARSRVRGWRALARFLGFFTGQLADTYLNPPRVHRLPAWLRTAARM